jgi:hypothetical protein
MIYNDLQQPITINYNNLYDYLQQLFQSIIISSMTIYNRIDQQL